MKHKGLVKVCVTEVTWSQVVAIVGTFRGRYFKGQPTEMWWCAEKREWSGHDYATMHLTERIANRTLGQLKRFVNST